MQENHGNSLPVSTLFQVQGMEVVYLQSVAGVRENFWIEFRHELSVQAARLEVTRKAPDRLPDKFRFFLQTREISLTFFLGGCGTIYPSPTTRMLKDETHSQGGVQG
jgi:hypothetical protein